MTIIGLTVARAITEMDCNIKIGSKDGGGFVFCGSVKDIDVPQIDKDIVDSIQKSKLRAQNEYDRLKGLPNNYDSFLKEIYRKRDRFIKKCSQNSHDAEFLAAKEYPTSREAYLKWKRELTEKKNKARSMVKTRSRMIETYTSVGDRKIVDIYKSIDEDDTMVLIFEGREPGAYWTTEECATGLVESDDGFKAVRTMTNWEFLCALVLKGAFIQINEILENLKESLDRKYLTTNDRRKAILAWASKEAL